MMVSILYNVEDEMSGVKIRVLPDAFKISSSTLVQTPPLTTGIVAVELWADGDAEGVE